MATVGNLRLNRQQLSQFLPNFEAIKAFEQLFANAYDTVPTDLESVEATAQSAQLQAAEALGQLADIANTLSLALYGAYQEATQQDVYSPPADQQKAEEVYIPPIALDKNFVGLGNVDNTSDANKPVSTAQQTALNAKLTAASNLSDLANAGTARTNLGLSTLQSTSGTVASTSGTPVTIFTADGHTNGAYLVCIDVNSAVPATFSALALVTSDAGVLRLTNLQTATLNSVSISGLNIQATQGSGAAQTLYYTVVKIS